MPIPHTFSVLILASFLALSGCRGPAVQQPGSADATAPESASLLESRLLDIVERQQALDAEAARPDARTSDIQRRFLDLARDYNLLIARNPDHLESRLLYGKFLANYGDAEGAYEQFLHAARIDPQVAVIHQQLGTYHAERDDPTRALAYYLNAVQLEPDNPVYHFGLGQLLAAFREPLLEEGAITERRLETDMLAAFRNAATMATDNLAFQIRYGEAFLDLTSPDWQTALAHWQSIDIATLPPASADAVRLHTAYVLLQLNDIARARELASMVTSPALQAAAAEILNATAE